MQYSLVAIAVLLGAAALVFLAAAATGRRITRISRVTRRGDRPIAAARGLIALGLALNPVAQLIRSNTAPSLVLTFLGLACLLAGIAVHIRQGYRSGHREPVDNSPGGRP